mmetsp:Transcript_9063/g.19536  ORF Transcript_9063/g.19536 Transcript_9063/m.19536 type:complete len:165 (-) Transcript_9063:17-511(-)
MDLVSLTDSDEYSNKDELLAAPRPYSSDGDPASSEEDFDGTTNDRDEHARSGKVEDVFRVQNPFDYNEVAQATLTNLDGDGSIKGIDSSYPEFEMFVNVKTPPTPQWPDGEDLYESQNEEYNTQRKRWQEEANDLDSIGLPDRQDASSAGSSYDDGNHGHNPFG